MKYKHSKETNTQRVFSEKAVTHWIYTLSSRGRALHVEIKTPMRNDKHSLWNHIHHDAVKSTWTQLFDPSLTESRFHRQKVFKPGDLWIRNTAGSTQHGRRSSSLHHLQLRTHVNAGKTKRQQILCTEEKKRCVKCVSEAERRYAKPIKHKKQPLQYIYPAKVNDWIWNMTRVWTGVSADV